MSENIKVNIGLVKDLGRCIVCHDSSGYVIEKEIGPLSFRVCFKCEAEIKIKSAQAFNELFER